MIDAGWTAAAIAKQSDVNQITVGNLKNGKGSRVTDKVFDKIMALKHQFDAGEIDAPTRKRKGAIPSAAPSATPSVAAERGKNVSAAKGRDQSPSDFRGMINTQYVPVDVERLLGMIDALISRFSGAIEELESIKSQLKS
jgi:hypothetical protein